MWQTARNHLQNQVMYTVIQSLTRDGRDRGLDYKISGFHVPPGDVGIEGIWAFITQLFVQDAGMRV